ncbi:MAG: hypothetical protein AB7O66_20455 [Limisphaerales bacterium]
MRTRFGRLWTGITSVITTVIAVGWMGWSMRAERVAGSVQHRGVGQRLAEEVAAVVGPTGRLVVVTLERGTSEALDLQHAAFCRALEAWPGLEVIRTDKVDGEQGGKYGPGTGLSARRYLRLVEKEPDAAAIVSFIGVPNPEDLPSTNLLTGPRLVAVSRSPKKLAPLIQSGLLVRAITPRFTFPAPGPEVPATPGEWFENRFQVVSEASVH